MISTIGSHFTYQGTCCTPIRWVVEKIENVAKAIFGYLLRITTFQLGEFKTTGAYWIMRIYQRLGSDPRDEKPFDAARLAKSKELLTRCGGVEATVCSADGNAKIQCMTFKSSDFFSHFLTSGSKKLDVTYEDKPRKVLTCPNQEIQGELEKFYLSIIDVKLSDGTICKGALLPEEVKSPAPLILHSHSPGRSMAMDRKYLGLHLGAGYDVAIWDPRGTVDSTGTPSEGGYYLDADAVYQHVLSLGYQHNRIYVSGYCKGAACASFLKKKYHHLGVNFIGSNLYTSMEEVLKTNGCLGRLAARFGLPSLSSTDETITSKVTQDRFDNVAKFRGLTRSEGKFILIHTDTDTMMPQDTVKILTQTIGEAGPTHEILRKHPNPKENGHMQPPYEDPNVWRRYIEVVT